MALQIILYYYQYSIEILNHFSVSLSIFKKNQSTEYFFVFKGYHFRKGIVQIFLVNCKNVVQGMPNYILNKISFMF